MTNSITDETRQMKEKERQALLLMERQALLLMVDAIEEFLDMPKTSDIRRLAKENRDYGIMKGKGS